MLSALRAWWPLAIIAAAAVWLRTHDLAVRPMHADEANQAVKLGELLETGRYTYDPRDHHGPTLYYLALPFAWVRGETSLATLSETTVRLVPAFFGALAVVLIALLAAPVGRVTALLAAGFCALAPPLVYYGRYFIQETLLLAFTLAAFLCAREGWRRRSLGWAAAAGACAGLMQATKASAPVFIIAALLAVGPALRAGRGSHARITPELGPARRAGPTFIPALLVAALSALFVFVLFYSSFFTNLSGLRDAFSVYTQSGARIASGATGHEKPWWYYLQLLGWQRNGGLFFHLVPLSALAAAGAVIAFVRPAPLLRAAVVYLLLVGAFFSALAYKTPWHVVHFLPAVALLAAGALAAIARLRTGKFAAIAFAIVTGGSLYQQTALTSFKRPADARNPFAYVHSGPDVLKFRPLADAARATSPAAPIRVIAEEYWPLPWYFRGLDNVGYWPAPPEDCDGALVITSPALGAAVRAKLRGNYRESVLGLRPGVLCIVFTAEKGTEGTRE